jgi:polygalacturonase
LFAYAQFSFIFYDISTKILYLSRKGAEKMVQIVNINFLRMMRYIFIVLVVATATSCSQKQVFPDGSEIPEWFFDNKKFSLDELGEAFVITDYGAVKDSTVMNTVHIQNTIDKAAEKGGVVVIPKGTYLTGALFFKPGTHLHVVEGGVLKGSDSIVDFPAMPSRMEGQNLEYFPAVVNAYGVNGFTITGMGKIDGNGRKYWEAFWQRRKENRKCTNLEVSRPRLVFIWNSNDVQIQDVKLHNSGFWTTHLYKCNNVKILDVHIFAPKKPIPAPSTDAIDLDVCTNVLIKGCYMSVNDDAIALKGGKGPWADEDTNNGPNFNILIEDCHFGWCHSVFTCGSESIHNRNVLMRNCTVDGASRLMFMKMRPDTPQKYEYITFENIKGSVRTCVYIRPWRQFFDLQGRETAPVSSTENITLSNLEITCKNFAETGKTEQDRLKNFTFKDLNITTEKNELDTTIFEGIVFSNVFINGEKYPQ